MKKICSVILIFVMCVLYLSGCSKKPQNIVETTKAKETGGLSDEEVTLTVAGPWSDCKALEIAAASFSKKYPNCHIVYEYLQDFNNTLPLRLSGTQDKIDLFLSSNIQKDSEVFPYMLDLSTFGDSLDLSVTFKGLIDNARLQSANEEESKQIYGIPLGAEIRGMFVNVSLLKSLNLDVPTNQEEFLAACKVLKENGYVPIQGNPGMFGQQFLYPYVCNLIANAQDYEKAYTIVNNREEKVPELLREPMELLYYLVENKYYDYKYCETQLNLFTDSSNEGYARSFLNIFETDTGYEKKDDLGQIAFMPSTQSLESVIEKTKDDYHSKISYEFILSPVGDNGGFAYLSPGRAISVNKETDNKNWCLAFLNYLFEKETNIEFADTMGFVPNTEDAFSILEKTYDIPKENICQLGQVTFDYDFFSVIDETLVEISKANNPKYMKTKEDKNVEMYPFSYYMNNFTDRLKNVTNE